MARVTAVFADHAKADAAIAVLRHRGVSDSHLSIVAKRVEDVEVAARRPEGSTGERVAKGAITGVGVGTLFGLAAALIPGVGPFLVAGQLATTLGATAGSAAAGAIVGGASGALAGAMARADFSKEEASFYGPLVERGDVLLTVKTDDVSSDRLRAELEQLGGRTYGAEPRREGTVDIRRED
jgi:hypothetical protein